ncbi:MAG: hypothetical protein OXH58_03560, partial [Acidimicrobiaceae bacterium]|nr:hypothetical protein [Acidimicrobiaceae bacterium]
HNHRSGQLRGAIAIRVSRLIASGMATVSAGLSEGQIDPFKGMTPELPPESSGVEVMPGTT